MQYINKPLKVVLLAQCTSNKIFQMLFPPQSDCSKLIAIIVIWCHACLPFHLFPHISGLPMSSFVVSAQNFAHGGNLSGGNYFTRSTVHLQQILIFFTWTENVPVATSSHGSVAPIPLPNVRKRSSYYVTHHFLDNK